MSELTKIKPIEANEQELQQLRSDYEKLVVTPQNIADADKARLKLKNKRLEIQRMQKANNQVLKEIKKDNDDRAEKLVAIIEPVEKRLDAEITAIEEAEKRRQEEPRIKEQNRVQGHRNRITAIAQLTARLALNQDINDIKAKIQELEQIGTDFEEFTQETLESKELFILSAQNRIKQLEAEWEEKLRKAEAIKKELEIEAEKKQQQHIQEGLEFTKEAESIEVKRPSSEGSGKDTTLGTEYPLRPEEAIKPEDTREPIYDAPEPKPYKIHVDSIQVPVNYSIMGFDFHIPENLPDKERGQIKTSIENILGAMEI